MSLLQNSNAIEAGGYPISNSLRFQSASSQYATRTFATSGTSNTIKTFSFWVKRGSLGSRQSMFGGYDGSSGNNFQIEWESTDTLQLFFGGAAAYEVTTTQVFRDPSAWYHIVATFDTTQATASNRYKLYVNGTQVTAFGTANYPPQNSTVQFGLNNGNNRIGTWWNASTAMLDGYLTEVNFIDGQALTPSSFGETNTLTGQWVAKKYTGTYGTNGFYLPFSNGTSTTTLGADSSGNGNNWTLTNFTRSAGVSDCWMYDVPSGNGSPSATQPSSNYAVLQAPMGNSAGSTTISNANLKATLGGSGIWRSVAGTIAPSSGKWYAEFSQPSGTANMMVGVSTLSANIFNVNAFYGITSDSWSYYLANGQKYTNNVGSAYGTAGVVGDVIGIAVDLDNGAVYFSKNGTWVNSGDPTSGASKTGAAWSITTGREYYIGVANASATPNDVNFGQRSFAYTPPSGFKALCTANLPASTIVKGNKYMDATTYNGNLVGQSITNAAGFKPDLVWVKSRSAATDNKLTDSVRGAQTALVSNSTAAETTDLTGVVSFNTNGFTLGTSTTYNNTGATYVGWQWQAGQGTTSSNTNGTITSTVSVSTTAGFSVVTWTGTGANATVGHGLGVAPKMIIVKYRNAAANWLVYHGSLANTQYLLLNTTAAVATGADVWNSTTPTSSVFSLGTNASGNQSTGTYVAYCFAEIAGFSKFGSYTGNGSADGNFLYFGFKPKWIMIKNITTSGFGGWVILDTSRNPSNVTNKGLAAESSGAEFTVAYGDVLSNGFKIRIVDNGVNASGQSYIYAAFAENPFSNSNGA